MMKRLVITWALAVVLFGLAGVAEAVRPAEPAKPFVNVSTTPDKLDLGTVPLTGIYDIPAAVTVEVEANCVHGPIVVSTTTLKRRQGGSILPERISVRTPATGGFVTMAKPVAISEQTAGSHKIVVDLKVQPDVRNLAGEYTGTFMFTVMPPS